MFSLGFGIRVSFLGLSLKNYGIPRCVRPLLTPVDAWAPRVAHFILKVQRLLAIFGLDISEPTDIDIFRHHDAVQVLSAATRRSTHNAPSVRVLFVRPQNSHRWPS